MFAKVENGETKSCQFLRRKNRENAIWHENFHFFQQDRLLFARVEIDVTEFPTKTAKKEEFSFCVSEFLFKSGCATTCSWLELLNVLASHFVLLLLFFERKCLFVITLLVFLLFVLLFQIGIMLKLLLLFQFGIMLKIKINTVVAYQTIDSLGPPRNFTDLN